MTALRRRVLIAQKWTSPNGLLCAVPRTAASSWARSRTASRSLRSCNSQVGVLDMLRFRDFTVGKGWESDYGSVDNTQEFKALLAYSPYQNVKANVDYRRRSSSPAITTIAYFRPQLQVRSRHAACPPKASPF